MFLGGKLEEMFGRALCAYGMRKGRGKRLVFSAIHPHMREVEERTLIHTMASSGVQIVVLQMSIAFAELKNREPLAQR